MLLDYDDDGRYSRSGSSPPVTSHDCASFIHHARGQVEKVGTGGIAWSQARVGSWLETRCERHNFHAAGIVCTLDG